MKKLYNFENIIINLEANKNIICNKEDEIYLERIGYINLITPYKHFFHKGKDGGGNHIYVEQVDIKKYVKLYEEDEKQTIVVREIIYRFEKTVKALMSYGYSGKYEGLEACINNTIISDIEKRIKFINNSVSKGTKNKDYKINSFDNLKVYIEEHEDTLLYLLINNMNFSQLKTFLYLYPLKYKECIYFRDNFNTLRKLRNSLSHGDTIQMHLNRLDVKEYKRTINCIKKVNSWNLKKEDVDYSFLKKSYNKYNPLS